MSMAVRRDGTDLALRAFRHCSLWSAERLQRLWRWPRSGQPGWAVVTALVGPAPELVSRGVLGSRLSAGFPAVCSDPAPFLVSCGQLIRSSYSHSVSSLRTAPALISRLPCRGRRFRFRVQWNGLLCLFLVPPVLVSRGLLRIEASRWVSCGLPDCSPVYSRRDAVTAAGGVSPISAGGSLIADTCGSSPLFGMAGNGVAARSEWWNWRPPPVCHVLISRNAPTP